MASSGQSSILTAHSWPLALARHDKPRTPYRRMLPSVIGPTSSPSPVVSLISAGRATMFQTSDLTDGASGRACHWASAASPRKIVTFEATARAVLRAYQSHM